MKVQIKLKLDERIENWELLKHPFYQAWNEGTLPKEALVLYAEEYGAFIRQIPAGWQGIGDEETVQEEVEHIELWEKFASQLGTQIGEGTLKETKHLLETSEKIFLQGEASILGALYAFETQQPETAATKLQGLQEHFSLDKSAEEYFIEHAHNHHETAKLLNRIEKLDEAKIEMVVDAAGEMAKALWDTLTGIYEQECLVR